MIQFPKSNPWVSLVERVGGFTEGFMAEGRNQPGQHVPAPGITDAIEARRAASRDLGVP